jgi:hypothetical protein
MEVMTLEEYEDDYRRIRSTERRRKRTGIETISDIEDGEDGNVCEYGLSQLMADCGETAAL